MDSHFMLLGKLFGFEIRQYSPAEWKKLQEAHPEKKFGEQVKVYMPWDKKAGTWRLP
jgi:hypothetical protein